MNAGAIDGYGLYDLIDAAKNNDNELVKTIVDSGHALDTKDSDQKTALWYAALNRNTENVQVLVDAERGTYDSSLNGLLLN